MPEKLSAEFYDIPAKEIVALADDESVTDTQGLARVQGIVRNDIWPLCQGAKNPHDALKSRVSQHERASVYARCAALDGGTRDEGAWHRHLATLIDANANDTVALSRLAEAKTWDPRAGKEHYHMLAATEKLRSGAQRTTAIDKAIFAGPWCRRWVRWLDLGACDPQLLAEGTALAQKIRESKQGNGEFHIEDGDALIAALFDCLTRIVERGEWEYAPLVIMIMTASRENEAVTGKTRADGVVNCCWKDFAVIDDGLVLVLKPSKDKSRKAAAPYAAPIVGPTDLLRKALALARSKHEEIVAKSSEYRAGMYGFYTGREKHATKSRWEEKFAPFLDLISPVPIPCIGTTPERTPRVGELHHNGDQKYDYTFSETGETREKTFTMYKLRNLAICLAPRLHHLEGTLAIEALVVAQTAAGHHNPLTTEIYNSITFGREPTTMKLRRLRKFPHKVTHELDGVTISVASRLSVVADDDAAPPAAPDSPVSVIDTDDVVSELEVHDDDASPTALVGMDAYASDDDAAPTASTLEAQRTAALAEVRRIEAELKQEKAKETRVARDGVAYTKRQFEEWYCDVDIAAEQWARAPKRARAC